MGDGGGGGGVAFNNVRRGLFILLIALARWFSGRESNWGLPCKGMRDNPSELRHSTTCQCRTRGNRTRFMKHIWVVLSVSNAITVPVPGSVFFGSLIPAIYGMLFSQNTQSASLSHMKKRSRSPRFFCCFRWNWPFPHFSISKNIEPGNLTSITFSFCSLYDRKNLACISYQGCGVLP